MLGMPILPPMLPPICEPCAIMLGGGLACVMRGVALIACLLMGVACAMLGVALGIRGVPDA